MRWPSPDGIMRDQGPRGEIRRIAPMRSRPLPVSVAAIIQVLVSLVSLPGPLLPGSEGIPAVVLYSGIVLGVAGLVASAGLWMLKKWGLWLTIIRQRRR